jgi:LysR family hydrogen peroxide-inducible transcriptional activator
MQFHQVRYFLAACDSLNFTRAAEESGVSQPALTKAIQKLEGEMGGQLFDRSEGRVELTELGKTMRVHLARIEETRLAASRAARAAVDGPRSAINLGIMCTVGPRHLGPALADFQARYPDIELILHDVWSRRGLQLLKSGGIDCAVMAMSSPLDEPLLVTETLYSEEMVVAFQAGHALARLPTVRLTDLEGVPYLDRLRCEFRELFFAEMAGEGFGVRMIMRSEREDWIQTAIAAGHGVSILPESSVTLSGIETRMIDGMQLLRNVCFVRDRAAGNNDSIIKLGAHLSGAVQN